MDQLKEVRDRRQAAADLAVFQQHADPDAAREIAALLDEASRSQASKTAGWISDADALENEDAFRRRFGLGFQWNPTDRRALFALKDHMQMTDSDVRLFRHTGTLRRSRDGFSLAARKRDALMGGAQIAILVLIYGGILLAIAPQAWHSLQLGLKAIGLAAGIWLLCYSTYWTTIKPWVRQRQLEHQPIDPVSSRSP